MTLTRRSFTALVVARFALPAFAASEPRWFNAGDDLAASGRDVVAYFNLSGGDGVLGRSEFMMKHKGTTLHFANAENLATFQADPDKYAPRFGGYCAYAVSKGGTATTQPDTWTIHEGKLYLNFNLTVRDIWRQDISGNVAKADANWPSVLEA